MNLTYGTYLERKNNPAGKALIEFYIAGIGNGFLWNRAFISAQGGKVFICEPDQLVLNQENYINILEREYNRKDMNYNEESALGSILYMGMLETFPCN